MTATRRASRRERRLSARHRRIRRLPNVITDPALASTLTHLFPGVLAWRARPGVIGSNPPRRTPAGVAGHGISAHASWAAAPVAVLASLTACWLVRSASISVISRRLAAKPHRSGSLARGPSGDHTPCSRLNKVARRRTQGPRENHALSCNDFWPSVLGVKGSLLPVDLSPGAGVIPADLRRGQPTGEEFSEFGLLSAIEGPFRDEADRSADLSQVPES
jgi:hypothetical protein